GRGSRDVIPTGVPIDLESALGMPVIHGSHTHARRAVHDLGGEAPAPQARADHADANGPPLLLTGPQRVVDDDHAVPPAASSFMRHRSSASTASSNGQPASFREIS